MKTDLVVYGDCPNLVDRLLYQQAATKAQMYLRKYQSARRSYDVVINLLSQEFFSLVKELESLTFELSNLDTPDRTSAVPISNSLFELDPKEKLQSAMAKRLYWRLAHKFHPDKPNGNKQLFQMLTAAKQDLMLLNMLYLQHLDTVVNTVNTEKLNTIAEGFDLRLKAMMAKPEWKIIAAFNSKNHRLARDLFESLVTQAIVVQKQRISVKLAGL